MTTEPILFSTELYREDAIAAAIDAYGAFAHFQLARRDDNFVISVRCHDPEYDEQIREAFCTHVLFETIVKYREATGAKL